MNGATVHIEIAEKVNCITCGKECYAMTPEYVCHKCWKDGSAALHIAQLRSLNTGHLKQISILQDRIEKLEATLRGEEPACVLCGHSVRGDDFVRLDGESPAHRQCCDKHGRLYREARTGQWDSTYIQEFDEFSDADPGL